MCMHNTVCLTYNVTCTCEMQVAEFYMDWDSPSIGTVLKDGTRSSSKGDFAIKLTAMVEAQNHTGYLALVKRRIDDKEK